MGISERLLALRRLLPGTPEPQTDERLMQLYWNRAELKKELARLQKERHLLLERVKKQEAATQRVQDSLTELELHLGDPETAPHALAYFQLRAIWRLGCDRVSRFGEQLRQQQEERERRRLLIEFNQSKQSRLAEIDRALFDARSTVDMLEAQLRLSGAKLESMRGFWNYFRRRRLADEMARERVEWDVQVTRVTDLSDDRAEWETKQPPTFNGLSVDGKRIVNTAVIAYAQQLVAQLTDHGIAPLARETNNKRVYEAKYGTREECNRLMAAMRAAMIVLNADNEDVGGLKTRTDQLRSHAAYRSDADTIPLTDSIGLIPATRAPVSGLDTINKAGINVLVDDYWDVYEVLMQ